MAWPAMEERGEDTEEEEVAGRRVGTGGWVRRDVRVRRSRDGPEGLRCTEERTDSQIGQEVDDVDVVVPVHVIKGKIALATSSGAA